MGNHGNCIYLEKYLYRAKLPPALKAFVLEEILKYPVQRSFTVNRFSIIVRFVDGRWYSKLKLEKLPTEMLGTGQPISLGYIFRMYKKYTSFNSKVTSQLLRP